MWNHQKFQLFLSLPCVHRNEPRPCNTLWDHHEGTNPYLELLWILGVCGRCFVPHPGRGCLKICIQYVYYLYIYICCYLFPFLDVFCALFCCYWSWKNYNNTSFKQYMSVVYVYMYIGMRAFPPRMPMLFTSRMRMLWWLNSFVQFWHPILNRLTWNWEGGLHPKLYTLIFQFPIYLESRYIANWELGSKYIGNWKMRGVIRTRTSRWFWEGSKTTYNFKNCSWSSPISQNVWVD